MRTGLPNIATRVSPFYLYLALIPYLKPNLRYRPGDVVTHLSHVMVHIPVALVALSQLGQRFHDPPPFPASQFGWSILGFIDANCSEQRAIWAGFFRFTKQNYFRSQSLTQNVTRKIFPGLALALLSMICNRTTESGRLMNFTKLYEIIQYQYLSEQMMMNRTYMFLASNVFSPPAEFQDF